MARAARTYRLLFSICACLAANAQVQPEAIWSPRTRDLSANVESALTRRYPNGPMMVGLVRSASLPPESYSWSLNDGMAIVEAADDRGAVYGLSDLSENLKRGSAKKSGRGAPYLADRGLNLFLTLPWNYEKNDSDYDPAALTDPARWWFHNDDYWTTLLDQMVDARLNWLDLHGTYDISVTSFPNLYAYFIASKTYPNVGVDAAIKEKNLARLNRVIKMAHDRGIRVSLMSYEAHFKTPHRPKTGYEETEAATYAYTREVVAETIRRCPELDAIGFRIGESGKSASFFNCYIEAVADAGRDIPLLTRSWITRKAQVVPLARASSDFTVEIKYNGEQWGPPYPVVGGRVPGWYSYSFEDYLSDSGDLPAKKMWPGQRTDRGETWPDEPYKIVWQVRANGTHRIFPFYEPDLVRRSITSMKHGTASGYTVEPLNAYFPAESRYYLKRGVAGAKKWIHQRDRMFMMLWGRLGYDPTTSDEVFDAAAKDDLGPGSDGLLEAWKAASRVIPTAFSAYAIGPDHRDHAPELEWGGDTNAFVQGEGFDSHSYKSAKEDAAYRATGGKDGRMGLDDAFGILGDLHAVGVTKIGKDDSATTPFARDIRTSTTALLNLSDYYRFRFFAALGETRADASPDRDLADDWRRFVALMTETAAGEHESMSDFLERAGYRPFTDRLRMHKNDFKFRDESKKAKDEAQRLRSRIGGREFKDHLGAGDARNDPPRTIAWQIEGESTVLATTAAEGIDEAWILEKPLPSATFFHKRAMRREGPLFVDRFRRNPAGHALALEVRRGDRIERHPRPTVATPYVVIPSQDAPTAPYYSAEESLTYLDSAVLRPDRYGTILIAQRAWNFHRRFATPVQRKILDAVEHGMTALVLQQDYTSGRYPLTWLLNPPKVENCAEKKFDPAGALGLEPIEADGILWQRFVPTPGWEIFGNGGIAHQASGSGHIWLVQARLMQTMYLPASARNLKKLLELSGREKPVVVVDQGTEGAQFSTAVFPDFMNAHDIPFLTLGEVIANDQGQRALTAIPGRPQPDRILDGQGPRRIKDLVEKKVKAAAARPVPSSKEAFEIERERAKKELMRGLGLDPLPPRTPLNARITGTLEREGYRIEKLVFESRPGFFVTAHVYVPAHDAGQRLPIIVNPHGHWQHKKQEPVVQARAIAQALAGYLAIVVDSPGYSFEGRAKIERRFAGPHDDLALVIGPAQTTGVYTWDLMRALDYLETRDDVDMSRIGITGASGGGLETTYAFAADERFRCAVPVCYATSFEVNPHNGCLCNHVPGALQIGDRAHVLAIRAPHPVLVIGAKSDGEFPPAGTELTGKKLKDLWQIVGGDDAAAKTAWRIFDSGHDYNRPMREAALGFFDLHLRGIGDGSPRAEPAIKTEPAESPELFVLTKEPDGARTMRDIARSMLDRGSEDGASFATLEKLMGGRPAAGPPKYFDVPLGQAEDANPVLVTVESESGLTLPGHLWHPLSHRPKAGIVLISERGKSSAFDEFDIEKLIAADYEVLAIDVRGCGELDGLDPRLLTYLGESAAFGMGFDAMRAAQALRMSVKGQIAVVGRGPTASQAALFAGLFDPTIDAIVGEDAPAAWGDAFEKDVNWTAYMPRAAYAPSLFLLVLEAQKRVSWTVRGDARGELSAKIAAILSMK